MPLNLAKVALIGRTYNEYKRMFGITKEYLEGRNVLDVAAGVSNFCAIGNVFGIDVTAVDPIYHLMADEIEVQAKEDLDMIINQLPVNLSHYNWDFYGDIEGVRVSRMKAYQTFLRDYEKNRKNYVASEIGFLPFRDKSFNTTLVSHLMFLYEHLFSAADHISMFKELIRVTQNEIIIFPTKNLSGENCKWVDLIVNNPEFLDHTFRLEKSQFEFQKGNSLRLRVTV